MAPPRKRTSKNRNLPPNLYPNGKYWQYRNPITGKKISINRPLAEAVKLARAANAKLAPLMVDDGELLSLLTGEEAPTFAISTGKTQNYENPIHLEIEMGADLRAIVQECLAEPSASPYLICYRPRARKREQINAKLHWSAVTDDYLTKEFRKARDAAHAYEHIKDPLARPTVHELRALGAWLYQQQGFSQEYVQALMGHATEEMTAYYQAGHEKKEIIYQRVQAGLKL